MSNSGTWLDRFFVASSIITTPFQQPPAGDPVDVELEETGWLSDGQPVFAEVGGQYKVAIGGIDPDGVTVTLINSGSDGNANPGVEIPALSKIRISGAAGPAGGPGAILGDAAVGGASASEKLYDWNPTVFPGDAAWHTLATLGPSLSSDEVLTLTTAVTLRRPAGTPGAILIRRIIAVQNVGGTLQGIDGTSIDHAIDTYGTPGANGAPSGAQAQIAISGQTLVVQAQATQPFFAGCVVSVDRRLAPGSTATPNVSTVSPSHGVASTTTAISIVGTTLTGATAAGVKVGATKYALTSFALVGSTSITGVLPTAVIGKGSVYVTVGGTDYVSTTPFWFLNAAAPSSDVAISPTTGTTAGGTTIALTATSGLMGIDIPGFGVTLDGVAATVVSVASDSAAVIQSNAGSAGTGAVVVTTPSGGRTSANTYTYVAPVASPATILGSNLRGWYPNSSIQHSGASCTGWNDMSGNGQNLTVQDGAPGYVSSSTHITPNGPAMSVAGADSLGGAFVFGASVGLPVFVMAIFRYTVSAGGAGAGVANVHGNQVIGIRCLSGVPNMEDGLSSFTPWGSSTLNQLQSTAMYSDEFIGGAGTNAAQISVGNATPVTKTFASSFNSPATGTATIGAASAGAAFGTGEIYEVIIANVKPNSTQLAQLETYAQSTYGAP